MFDIVSIFRANVPYNQPTNWLAACNFFPKLSASYSSKLVIFPATISMRIRIDKQPKGINSTV